MTPVGRRRLLRTGLGAAGLLVGLPILDGESRARLVGRSRVGAGSGRESMPVTVRRTSPASDPAIEHAPAQGPGRLLAVQRSDLVRTGLVAGQQVRLRRDDHSYASFTVVGVSDRDSRGTVWLDADGLARVDATEPSGGIATDTLDARLRAPVPASSRSLSAARETGEYVETVLGAGNRVAVIAPHGGAIEAGTARQAARTVESLPEATGWLGRGFRPGGGAFERWHVTSTALHPASYPGLARLASRPYHHAVAFHGFAGSGVLVGGGASLTLRRRVRDALAAALPATVSVRLARDGPYDGDDPANPVNWLTRDGRGGIQLEQGRAVRADHGVTVADTVADVLEAR